MHADLLKKAYLRRREREPGFSTRAFARELGISQAMVSLILSGKRVPGAETARKLAPRLELTAPELREWLRQDPDSGGTASDALQLEIDRIAALAAWHHVALLELRSTAGFRAEPDWVAARLGITPLEAADALARLERLGMKHAGDLRLGACVSEHALRRLRRQLLEKGTRKDATCVTLALGPRGVERLQEKLRAICRELRAADDEEPTEVYQLNLQLFALSKATP